MLPIYNISASDNFPKTALRIGSNCKVCLQFVVQFYSALRRGLKIWGMGGWECKKRLGGMSNWNC
jgi:hypothetical protein